MYAEQHHKWHFQETVNYVYFGDVMSGVHFIIKKEENLIAVQLMKLNAEEWRGVESLNFVCAKVRSHLRLFNHNMQVQ